MATRGLYVMCDVGRSSLVADGERLWPRENYKSCMMMDVDIVVLEVVRRNIYDHPGSYMSSLGGKTLVPYHVGIHTPISAVLF